MSYSFDREFETNLWLLTLKLVNVDPSNQRSLDLSFQRSLALCMHDPPYVYIVQLSTLEVSQKSLPYSNQLAHGGGGPGSNHSQTLMAGNFAALLSTDPKFSALKDLNPFKIV